MGSDCSLIRYGEAQVLGLDIIQTQESVSAFNYALVTPIARAITALEIDEIMFQLEIYIVPDEQLSKKRLIGRDILATPKVKAIVDAAEVKFEGGNVPRSQKKPLEVNMVKSAWKDITESDVLCPEVNDPKVIDKLVSLLKEYRTTIAQNMKEPGAAKGTVMKIKLIDNEPVHYRPRRCHCLK